MSTDMQYPQFLPVEEQPSKDLLVAYITGHLGELLEKRSYKQLAQLYYKILIQVKVEIDPEIRFDNWLQSYLDDDPALEFNGWGSGPGEW